MHKLDEEFYREIAAAVVEKITETVDADAQTLIEGFHDYSTMLTVYMNAIHSEAIFELTFAMMTEQSHKAQEEHGIQLKCELINPREGV